MMLKFGTSAYLKLLALDSKPGDTELRRRMIGGSDGYDFHKAMRRIAVGYASGHITPDELKTRIQSISKPAERIAAASAVVTFSDWLAGRLVASVKDGDLVAESPTSRFLVRFQPDFDLDDNGRRLRIHIWNTAKPVIRLREAIGLLGLFRFPEAYGVPGVLSLRTKELFVLHDISSSSQLALFLARDVENRIDRIKDEFEFPARRDHPSKRAS